MFFTKATHGRNDFLFYVVGVIAVFFGYAIGQLPMVLVQYYQVSRDKSIGTAEVEKFLKTLDFTILNIHSNVGLILMITVFIFAMLALMLVLKYLHERPIKYTITPRASIDFNKIFFGFGLWFVLGLVFEATVAFLYPETYYFNFKPMSWIFLLLICVFLLPIQTSLEEIFMRGYLMPGLSVLTNNKIVPLVVTSILFGMIHGMNPEVEKFGFWTMQLYYVGAGLFLGLITILDDSLELALGVHAATNIFGAAFFSFDGSVLQTDSIVKCSDINPYMMILTLFLSAFIFGFICNKKYKWGGMKRLFSPIEEFKPQDDQIVAVLDNHNN